MNISDSTDFSSEENTSSESTDNAANEGELSLDQNGKLLVDCWWNGVSDVQKRINQDFGVVMTHGCEVSSGWFGSYSCGQGGGKAKEPSPEGTEGMIQVATLDPNATETQVEFP